MGGVRLTLASGDVGLRVKPGDVGGGSVVHVPKADHQDHGERAALPRLTGAIGHPDPGTVDGEGSVGHFALESTGGGDHHCYRLRREARVWLGRRAGDTPLQNMRVPGPSGPCVDGDLAGEVLVRSALSGGWSGGWSGGVITRDRPPAETPASANRRILVVLSARAVRGASLAREVTSRAREAERTASSEALAAALEALAA